MSDASGDPNPFPRRARIRSLYPELESLATEYNRESEPLRIALNGVLDAGPNLWAEAMFAAGERFALLDLSESRWGYATVPDHRCTDRVLARYTLLHMARAASVGDRAAFDRWLADLGAEPAVAAEAVGNLLAFALALVAHVLTESRDRTRERFHQLLGTIGLETSCNVIADLKQAGCSVSPLIEAAVNHWIDRNATPCWTAKGRITPLTDLTSPLDVTPEDVAPPAPGQRGEGEPNPVGHSRRPSRKLTPEEHQAVENAVGKYITDNTAAVTEAERRRLAKAITIKAVAEVTGRSEGYISAKSKIWRKFEAERKKWASPRQTDALDRTRGVEQFAKRRSRNPSAVGRARASDAGSGGSGSSGIESLADGRTLDPAEAAAVEELRQKYLVDNVLPADLRNALLTMTEESQRVVLQSYEEELEERRRAARARKCRS